MKGRPVTWNLVTVRVLLSTSVSLLSTLPVVTVSSFRVTLSLAPTGRSLLPLMVTVTLVLVPSAAKTSKDSVSLSSTFSSLKAELATKVQAPAALMLKVP
ncbi:hypothetical protein D9M69_588010 [compost metagenome]